MAEKKEKRNFVEEVATLPIATPHHLTPYLRNPLTDLTGCLVNHQQYGRCGDFEIDMMECLEAYGLEKGRKKCADLIDDFNECHTQRKQLLRFNVSAVVFI